jgi:uncharacterized protein with PIN domain
MTISRIGLVAVAEAEVNGALLAYARYGKGAGGGGERAGLNGLRASAAAPSG